MTLKTPIKHLSFSKLSTFAKNGPHGFKYKYIDERETKTDDSQILGSIVDVIVFTPELYNVKFIVGNKPMVAGKLGQFIESYAIQKAQLDLQIPSHLPLIQEDDLDLMRNAYKDAEYKLDYDLVVKSFKEEKSQEYFNYIYNKIVNKTSKTYISSEEANKAIYMAKALSENAFTEEWERLKGFNQYEGFWYHPLCEKIPFLSIIDKVTVDEKNKTIFVDDLKTTSKPLINIHESIEEYRYDWQAALYKKFVKDMLEQKTFPNFKEEYNTYKIVNRIVALSSTRPYPSLIVEFTESTLYRADLQINSVLEDLLWHLETNMWEYPREIYENNGVLKY